VSARISLVCIAIATLALTLGYGLSASWAVAPVMVALGVVWAMQQHRGRAWASPAGLALAVIAAGAGFWAGVRAGWLLVGVVAALSAWDLDQFEQHLRGAGQVLGRPEMERRHLLRLALADTIGLTVAIVALQVQVHFTFFAALLLAALAVLGVSELIVYLRKGREG
jgi:hypothetical protein